MVTDKIGDVLEECLKLIQRMMMMMVMMAAAKGKEETKKKEIMLECKCVCTVMKCCIVCSDEVTHGVQ